MFHLQVNMTTLHSDFFATSDIFLLHLWDHFKGLQINKFLLHLIQLYRHNICPGIFIEWLVSQMFGYGEFSKLFWQTKMV